MLNAPLITVYRFGVYFTAFLLGYFLLSHEAVQLTLENRRRPLLLAALGMNVGFTVLYWGQNYTDYAILKGFFANACAWVGTLAAIGCSRAWLDREGRASRWLVKHSWDIYVLHYLPLLIMAILLSRTALPPAAVYLFTALGGGGGTLVLSEVIRRIPGFRSLVLGTGASQKR